jgi:erythronate-4-phosphate dehydrogenase
MRLFIDENIPQGSSAFSVHGDVTLFAGRALRREDLAEADALLVRSITKVNTDLLEGTPVKFVGTATIGVDHVDLEYLRARGIGFSAAPGCNARSVAEYFAAALLHLQARHGLELEGRTVGVVGYGNVGKAVAAIAPALGLKVLVSDPPLAEAGHPGEFLPLRELAERADIVTFHTPLTKAGPHPTQRMAGKAFFAALASDKGRGKTLMNMGRGEAFDEPALLEALDAGALRHLVLDVFPGEPNVNPELARRADLITPHIAGYSIQGKLNGTGQILTAFRGHFGLPEKSGVVFPRPPQPLIVNPKSVFEAVLRSYDVARDDADLRAHVGNPDFAKEFDLLRKRYPVRHEFGDFTVSDVEPDLRQRLAGLGFNVI